MRRAGFIAIAFAALVPTASFAQIARVMSVQGTSMLERSGQSPRILGIGDPIAERDTINVGRESNALLEFRDRTRITLRPNSVFRINAYVDNERPAMDVRTTSSPRSSARARVHDSRPPMSPKAS